MSDGKERPGLYDALAASWVKPISSDPRDSGEIGYDVGYEIGKREGAHASLAQQAAFAQACAPRGDDPRPGLKPVLQAHEVTEEEPSTMDVALDSYDAGREQGRQETLLACAEERVLAASQPMSGEVRDALKDLVLYVQRHEVRPHLCTLPEAIEERINSILAMGTRTDVEAGT